MPLRKEDIERIGNGAIKYLHSIPLSTDGRYEIQIKAYISGATAEAEKANELVEALEGLLRTVDILYNYIGNEGNIETDESYNFAKTAISNYKK